MIRVEQTIDIEGPPDVVWRVMTDVERWPQWTSTTVSAARGEDTAFGLGSTAHLRLTSTLGMSVAGVWTVISFENGRSFEWENRSAGVYSVAGHRVEPRDAGARVTLSVRQSGVMATLLSPMLRRVSARNVEIEAGGLKREAERVASERA